MRDNKITKDQLFEQMDRNKDGFIKHDELVAFFTQNQTLVEGLSDEAINKLWNFLDINHDGEISINEFCVLIEGVDLSYEMRMKSFSVEFEG